MSLSWCSPLGSVLGEKLCSNSSRHSSTSSTVLGAKWRDDDGAWRLVPTYGEFLCRSIHPNRLPLRFAATAESMRSCVAAFHSHDNDVGGECRNVPTYGFDLDIFKRIDDPLAEAGSDWCRRIVLPRLQCRGLSMFAIRCLA